MFQLAPGICVEGLRDFFEQDVLAVKRRLGIDNLLHVFEPIPVRQIVYEQVAKFRVLCDGVRKFIFDEVSDFDKLLAVHWRLFLQDF
jgi:hypothetical protein